MQHPNPDILLAIAIGDAYGAGFEFVGKQFIKEHNTMDYYVQNPRYPELLAGMYTDDTQMSIAVAEWLIADSKELQEVFVEVYKRDPRKGYSRRIQTALDTAENGDDFLKILYGSYGPSSIGNGTVMRAVPLGVLPFLRIDQVAAMQANLTHGPFGIGPAIVTAAMSHFALYESAPLSDLQTFLFDNLCIPQDEPSVMHTVLPWHGGTVPCDGAETVRAVYSILTQATSQKDALDRAIKLGGDTDSVAAITLGIASARLENDLPANLVDELEVGGKYGPEFLKQLGAKLMSQAW
jgi:ADP-ribosylglycohydrolase